ncbi:hypothetical protein KM043_008453 [Ampulex compressa]|nr:hypothetical protein KM043_008453 [Ampulex compressa]
MHRYPQAANGPRKFYSYQSRAQCIQPGPRFFAPSATQESAQPRLNPGLESANGRTFRAGRKTLERVLQPEKQDYGAPRESAARSPHLITDYCAVRSGFKASVDRVTPTRPTVVLIPWAKEKDLG